MGLSDSVLLEDDAKNLWDAFWLSYRVKGIDSWGKRRIACILSDYTRPDIDVLDAGCGSGFFSSYFISSMCNVYSMDYSERALAIAKRRTENKSKRYMRCNILDDRDLRDVNKRFDIIFTDGLLEHYPAEEQDRIISNMKRLKRENGYMINFVPNRYSLWSLVRPFFMKIKERPFVMSDFLELHKRNGLKVIACGGVNVLPFRISPEERLGKSLGMLFYCVAV